MGNALDKGQFYNNLHALIDAGVLLNNALSTCATGSLRESVLRLKRQVEGEHSLLSKAMRKQPESFSRIECDLVSLGEHTGTLPYCLKGLSVKFENLDRIRKQIINASLYPMLLLHLAPFLLGLPALVRSGSIWGYFHQIALTLLPLYFILFVLLIALPKLRSSVSKVALWFDTIALRIPVLGDTIRSYNLALFMDSLRLALDAGMEIHQAIRMSADSCQNMAIRIQVAHLSHLIREGRSLSESFQSIAAGDTLGQSFLAVGELSGKQVTMIDKLREYYFEQFDTTLKRAAKVLPVALFMAMAAVVGSSIVKGYTRSPL